jgi:hypothetical protein
LGAHFNLPSGDPLRADSPSPENVVPTIQIGLIEISGCQLGARASIRFPSPFAIELDQVTHVRQKVKPKFKQSNITISVHNYRPAADLVKINHAVPKYRALPSLRIRGFVKRYGCIQTPKRVP